MEHGGELPLDVKEVVERGPELRCKNRSAVTDDRVQKAIILYHHVNNYFRQSWNINGDLNWLVVHYLGQSVDNDENRVVAIALLVRR